MSLETFLFACHRWYLLHAEHPQAAKVLSSSQTSCLAMAEHSPTAWSGLPGQFRAGHMGPECARFAS